MSESGGSGFTRLFKRPENSGVTTEGALSSLSVNSLAKLSNQISVLSKGDNIKALAFWICMPICASLVADLTALLAEKYLPTPPVSPLSMRTRNGGLGTNPMAYEVISDRNLFSSRAPKKSGDEIDLDAEPVLSSLNYQLIGTVIFRNPARSLAAVQDKTENKLYPVRAGDQIGPNVQVLSVEARKLIFINSQSKRKEYIEIPEDPAIKISTASSMKRPVGGVTQADEGRFVVSRAEIDSQMANFNVLITQARAVPEMRGGQMIGFKLMQIVPNSFYSKVGFKENDIITAVNGEKITDAAKALELLQGLKSMASLDIDIERSGKAVHFNYDIR